MGLGYHITEGVIREHSYRAISGDILLIGRQTVYLPLGDILTLMRQQGIPTDGIDLSTVEIDRSTQNRAPDIPAEPITDRALFRLLGARNVRALDHSNYEGADLIHDLRCPIPDSIEESADFILDGSVLDNVFDPALALRNYNRLLRPHGRLLTINAMTWQGTPYTIATPLWYLDYFVLNGFIDCKVYVVVYDPAGTMVLSLDAAMLQHRGWYDALRRYNTPHLMGVIVLAEKGPQSTVDKVPNQADYRSEDEWDAYDRNLAAMLVSRRPHLTCGQSAERGADLPEVLKPVGPDYRIADGSAEVPTPAPAADPILDRLRRAFEEAWILVGDTLEPEMCLEAIDGLDSVSRVRLMLSVEETFEIQISPSEHGRVKTVADLVELIDQKRKEPAQ